MVLLQELRTRGQTEAWLTTAPYVQKCLNDLEVEWEKTCVYFYSVLNVKYFLPVNQPAEPVGQGTKGLLHPTQQALWQSCPIKLSPKFLVAKLWNLELTGSLFLWLFAASFQVFKKYFSNTSVCLVVQTLLLLQRVWAVPKLPSPHVWFR